MGGGRPRRWQWGVWLLAILTICAWPNRPDLLDPDEGRHAEIAREMLAGHSYLVPRLHGQPYHHKPVAFHWLAAASIAAFGRHTFAPRLPSMAAGLLALAATAWWARVAFSPPCAAVAVGMLATTPFFVVLARLATLDMLFTSLLTAALAWLGLWLARDPGCRPSIYPFYALVGLATLVKGPAAIAICGLVAAAAALALGGWRVILKLRPLAGGLLVLAVAGPWYLAAWQRAPDYIEEFLLRHNLARYAGGGHIGHQHGWFYYPAVLPLILLPWTPVVGAAVVARARRPARSPADLYALIWASALLAFYWPASTRLATYLLPAFPPLAVLAARFALDLDSGGARLPWLAHYVTAWVLTGAAVGLGAAAVAWWWAGGSWGELVPAALPLAVATWWWPKRTGAPSRLALATLAGTTAALLLAAYGPGARIVNAAQTTRSSAELVARELPPQADLASFHCFQHALAFYAGRTVRKARLPGEAVHGLAGPGPAALLTKEKYFEELGLKPLPEGVTIRWRGGPGCVLLWKPEASGTAEVGLAEKGGSRTLRRPLGPASRF